jgi:hypothetical protein
LGDSRSEKRELAGFSNVGSWETANLRREISWILKGQTGQGYAPLTSCRWMGDSRSEKGERARDIHPYLLPVVARQQI